MPDGLSRKLKKLAAERNTTMRSLIIDALERNLAEPRKCFRLRDGSAGGPPGHPVDTDAINAAVDEMREPRFRP